MTNLNEWFILITVIFFVFDSKRLPELAYHFSRFIQYITKFRQRALKALDDIGMSESLKKREEKVHKPNK
jgi:Sec-independent protein translocase protein TatA